MGANTCVGSSGVATGTGIITGTDPDFILENKVGSSKNLSLMIKYTKGTSSNVAITFDLVNPSLSTDKYRMTERIADASTAVRTITLTATGNYKINIEKIPDETIIYANITFAESARDAVAQVNFMEE